MLSAGNKARYKQEAAARAVQFIQPGMVVGLGAGSTAAFAVQRIAQLLHSGELGGILGIPCQETVAAQASALGIPLTTLEEHPVIDVTIDGADEVDPDLNLIKGGGGALLREKLVAQATRREIIIVDESKLSAMLGTHWAVPVEVVPFGWRSQVMFIESLGARPLRRLKSDGTAYQTDQGNYILDCPFGPIAAPAELAARLKGRTGIVDHGLFLGLTSDLIVAGASGVQHHRRANS